MTIRWTPDTCDCVIDVAHDTLTFVDWFQKCEIHKNFDGATLLSEIDTHNKVYQFTGNPSVKSEKKSNQESKRAEKDRIKALGPGVKHGN